VAAGLAGVAGPAVFTAAWSVLGHRQDGYPVRDEHISGLAARDATRPAVMRTAFFVLGSGTVALAAGLVPALGGRRAGLGPWLVGMGGLAQLTAGAFRRDFMLLAPPDRDTGWQQSRANDGHDASAGVAYVTGLLAPLLLARRFRGDPAWSWLAPVGVAVAVTSGALAVFFATDVDRKGNGIVQRAMVSADLAFQVLVGANLAATSVR
jgi:hypothetical protein